MVFHPGTGIGPLFRRMIAVSLSCGLFVSSFAVATESSAQGPILETISSPVHESVLVAEMVTSRTAPTSEVVPGEPVWHEELETGWRESKRTGRPMVIFITSESCTFCDAMTRNTLCEESVRRRLSRGFVPIRLRPDRNGNVLSRVKVTTFPTTLVAVPEGKVVAERFGYQPPEQFHGLLLEASETIASNSSQGEAATGVH